MVRDKKDPYTLTSMNNRAGVLSFQGKDEEGGRSIDIHSGRARLHCPLGTKHPSTLTSMSNLALILHIEEKDIATRESQTGQAGLLGALSKTA
jgi:hypothetical protein